jgi:CDP-2,3-bis-(O-geranylgeranyl)-sn-glycerol synthase
MGLGAHLGDLSESFFKRRIGITPGKPLIFFDQTDWVIGSFLVIFLISQPRISILLLGIVIYFFLHIIVKHIAYSIGTDDKKW